jgi:hypothetical protein
MKLYCNKCFAKTEYKFSKPKFCPECGTEVGASSNFTQKQSSNNEKINKDLDRIQKLEAEIEKLKSEKSSPKKRYEEDVADEYGEEDDYENEDYNNVQRHISNFKRMKNKSGVKVENDSRSSGITFGQLFESSSESSFSSSEDFKMSKDAGGLHAKSSQQILEELRAEASSQARVIEID